MKPLHLPTTCLDDLTILELLSLSPRSGNQCCLSQDGKIKEIVYTIYLKTNLYNKTRNHIYMLPIAGQTAGPIGLKFVVDTQGWPGGFLG